jgi:hypothetical protein
MTLLLPLPLGPMMVVKDLRGRVYRRKRVRVEGA